jgi:hypothetical protein
MVAANNTRTDQEPAEHNRDALNDPFIYRMTVGILGSVMLIGAFGAIYLQAVNTDVPALLVALGSGAAGALAGLIAPSPARPS